MKAGFDAPGRLIASSFLQGYANMKALSSPLPLHSPAAPTELRLEFPRACFDPRCG
jgi:hypothetical protein